ncbi:secreted aspartic proteinase precursor [Xylaria sp. CBS 124048]|nr:secreted aspartic proteinase precursor [Xylaria sp. CBS 124048]
MIFQPTAAALAAALAGFVAASPVKPPTQDNNNKPASSFSVVQIPNHNFRSHGPAQLAKTLSKYGVKLPDGLARTVSQIDAPLRPRHRQHFGSAPTTPKQYDVEYLTPVQIGTPPQTLNLEFDSTTAALWVMSTDLPPHMVDGQALYDARSSSTSQIVSDVSWSTSYGGQSSASGKVYRDIVTVGGVTVEDQVVEVATKVSTQFTLDGKKDGLFGLAFSSMNAAQLERELTWFDNAVESTLDEPVWTADLKYHQAGSYDFGFIDPEKYTGSIAYVDVNATAGFWMTNLTGYGIGSTNRNTSYASRNSSHASSTFIQAPFQAVVDTSTSLAMLPHRIVGAYYRSVPGARVDSTQGGYVFPCSAPLPDFILGVGNPGSVGVELTIPGQYVNYAPAVKAAGADMCFGGIQSAEGMDFPVLGDIVLKAAFVVFDAGTGKGNPRLGWATKKVSVF